MRRGSQNVCPENFLEIIIKAFLAEFIFSKILYFQHVIMNTFRQMCLNYKNCSLRRILF